MKKSILALTQTLIVSLSFAGGGGHDDSFNHDYDALQEEESFRCRLEQPLKLKELYNGPVTMIKLMRFGYTTLYSRYMILQSGEDTLGFPKAIYVGARWSKAAGGFNALSSENDYLNMSGVRPSFLGRGTLQLLLPRTSGKVSRVAAKLLYDGQPYTDLVCEGDLSPKL